MSDTRTSETERPGDDDRTPLPSVVTPTLVAIRGSFTAFVTTIGVVLLLVSVVLSGSVIPGFEYGILAAMALIWGVSALVYAVLGRIGLRLIGYR